MNLAERHGNGLLTQHIDALREAFRVTKQGHPFVIEVMVVLLDHLHRHLDYIHYNPVKHGHVERAIDWPYSSFHRYVARGLYPANWTAPLDVSGLAVGE